MNRYWLLCLCPLLVGLPLVACASPAAPVPEPKAPANSQVSRASWEQNWADTMAAGKKEELAKAKRMLISDFAYGNETNSNVATTLGRYQTISSLDEALSYVDRIRAVTAEDVQRAMAVHGKREACTVAYVKPKGKA